MPPKNAKKKLTSEDIDKLFPSGLVKSVVRSKSRREWDAKVFVLCQYAFIQRIVIPPEAINAVLPTLQPTSPGIVAASSEGPMVVGILEELSDSFSSAVEYLARLWLSSPNAEPLKKIVRSKGKGKLQAMERINFAEDLSLTRGPILTVWTCAYRVIEANATGYGLLANVVIALLRSYVTDMVRPGEESVVSLSVDCRLRRMGQLSDKYQMPNFPFAVHYPDESDTVGWEAERTDVPRFEDDPDRRLYFPYYPGVIPDDMEDEEDARTSTDAPTVTDTVESQGQMTATDEEIAPFNERRREDDEVSLTELDPATMKPVEGRQSEDFGSDVNFDDYLEEDTPMSDEGYGDHDYVESDPLYFGSEIAFTSDRDFEAFKKQTARCRTSRVNDAFRHVMASEEGPDSFKDRYFSVSTLGVEGFASLALQHLEFSSDCAEAAIYLMQSRIDKNTADKASIELAILKHEENKKVMEEMRGKVAASAAETSATRKSQNTTRRLNAPERRPLPERRSAAMLPASSRRINKRPVNSKFRPPAVVGQPAESHASSVRNGASAISIQTPPASMVSNSSAMISSTAATDSQPGGDSQSRANDTSQTGSLVQPVDHEMTEAPTMAGSV